VGIDREPAAPVLATFSRGGPAGKDRPRTVLPGECWRSPSFLRAGIRWRCLLRRRQ
jgi:hypothetical protein